MDKYMAYVAKKYPATLSYTAKEANYRGRFVNREIQASHSLIGESLSIWLLPPIASEIRQVLNVTPDGRLLSWGSLCRAIFVWGLNGAVKPSTIWQAEKNADKIDLEEFAKNYKGKSQVARISVGTKKQVKESVTALRDAMRDLMIQTSDDEAVHEYTKTYLINMIFAKFIDEKKPLDELLIL
jgi:hypothetical protein